MPLGANIFCLNLGLSSNQPEILSQLKSRGDQAIQTASGLCVKSSMTRAELEQLLEACESAGVKIEVIDSTTDRSSLSPDVQAFLNSN